MGEYSFTITTAIVPPPSPSPRPINVVHVLWLRFSRYQLIKRTCGYPPVVGVYAVSQITAQSSIYPFGKSNFTTLRQKMWGDQYHKLTEILISNFDLCSINVCLMFPPDMHIFKEYLITWSRDLRMKIQVNEMRLAIYMFIFLCRICYPCVMELMFLIYLSFLVLCFISREMKWHL